MGWNGTRRPPVRLLATSVSLLAIAAVTSFLVRQRIVPRCKSQSLPAASSSSEARSQQREAVLIGGRQLRHRLMFLLPVADLDPLDVEAECLQLTDEHVERLRHAGVDCRPALDDGLVDLGTAIDVVGLGSEQLLQD